MNRRRVGEAGGERVAEARVIGGERTLGRPEEARAALQWALEVFDTTSQTGVDVLLAIWREQAREAVRAAQ